MAEVLKPGGKVHIMGIGGFGMNPIARVMRQMGYTVTGCDLIESPLIAPLRDAGITVEIGHSPAHLETYQPDALVISSAIPKDNTEVAKARELKIPVYKRSDILGLLMADRKGIAVAGTHGKTTTSALLAWTLDVCELDPSFIVGGVLNNVRVNARAGKGEPFVIEADEYDRMFMGLKPKIAIVTTLEHDHPDMFESLADVEALFTEFVGLLGDEGLLVAGVGEHGARKLADRRREAGLPVVTYGLNNGDWTAADIRPNAEGGMSFTAMKSGKEAGSISLRLPGLHNVQNALAVIAVVDALGVDINKAAMGLSTFTGVGRRFEVKGEAQGVTIIDDYAHHPTAIRATLDAARLRFVEQSIWAVWQPHTYSRTKTLLDEFAASFFEADHVIITDVYRSRDVETFGIGPDDILARMQYHRDACHIPTLDEVVEYLETNVQPGDVVIVMSAGDATQVADRLLEGLRGESG
ncbi:MAG: UDP-N-acetylmuramate--L-alanine ligase [Anaerolineae bacterium]|nr:UDP-N-acetylmuramate--L-alanine ligase [Anaerolineae bacterium]